MPGLDIATLMAPLGPFERPPSVAVAVSGGSDSLGLGLLLAEWVRDRGGQLIVLWLPLFQAVLERTWPSKSR